MRPLLACLALVITAPALAEPDTARAAYAAGDWASAEALGERAQTAASMTIAAEAVLAPLILGQLNAADRSDKRARAREAADLARAAIALDPGYARAHLTLATALGYEGRYSHPVRAALARLPQTGRSHIEQAVALDPENAWGHALLGAWHLEIVRRAGERTFGANSAAGIDRYRAAAAMADSPAIPYHFALALLAHDGEAHGEEALALLETAAAMPAETAFDAGLRDRARDLLQIAETHPSTATQAAVRRLEE